MKNNTSNDPYHHIVSINKGEEIAHKGNLYLGGVAAFKKSEEFHQKNITSVLTVIDDWSFNHFKVKQKLEHLSIQGHKRITIQDNQQQTIYPFFEESHEFLKEELLKTNVFVHCQMGISRSSTLVIAFLMKEFGMPLEQARMHTKTRRAIIQPNDSFVEDLQRYEGELRAKKIIKMKEK